MRGVSVKAGAPGWGAVRGVVRGMPFGAWAAQRKAHEDAVTLGAERACRVVDAAGSSPGAPRHACEGCRPTSQGFASDLLTSSEIRAARDKASSCGTGDETWAKIVTCDTRRG